MAVMVLYSAGLFALAFAGSVFAVAMGAAIGGPVIGWSLAVAIWCLIGAAIAFLWAP